MTQIFTIDISSDRYITDDIMVKALTGTSCFVVQKTKENIYTIGAITERDFYDLGKNMGRILQKKFEK